MDFFDARKEYQMMRLSSSNLSKDPFEQFDKWFKEAVKVELIEPSAMQLATADKRGVPSCRTVLMRGYDDQGFKFFTNYESRKGRELQENPKACLLFYWKNLERQVVIEGKVAKASREVSEQYFHKRSRNSQISSFVSDQSRPLESRKLMEEECAKLDKIYTDREIPLPEDWGGFIVTPYRIEFWQGRESRMHDRFEYVQDGKSWRLQRLWP